MNEPLFHPKTKLLVESYLRARPHALLMIAPDGSGKLHRALWLAEQTQLTPIHVSVQEDKKLIGIEQIQQLYTQTRSGRPTMVVIEGAELMSTDAQNALLKLLEEPPENTHFVLTSSDTGKLLSTIRSRCQIISLIPPSTTDVKDYITPLSDELSDQERGALLATTQGRIGLLMSILADSDANADHASIVSEAKQFYSGNAYQRLSLAQEHGLEREWALRLLGMLSVILSVLIEGGTTDPRRAQTLQRQANEIERATSALQQAGNPKIHLSRLALAL